MTRDGDKREERGKPTTKSHENLVWFFDFSITRFCFGSERGLKLRLVGVGGFDWLRFSLQLVRPHCLFFTFFNITFNS